MAQQPNDAPPGYQAPSSGQYNQAQYGQPQHPPSSGGQHQYAPPPGPPPPQSNVVYGQPYNPPPSSGQYNPPPSSGQYNPPPSSGQYNPPPGGQYNPPPGDQPYPSSHQPPQYQAQPPPGQPVGQQQGGAQHVIITQQPPPAPPRNARGGCCGCAADAESALAYFLGMFSAVIVILLDNENETCRFHGFQSLLWSSICFAIVTLIQIIWRFTRLWVLAYVYMAASFTIFCMWIFLMVSAYQGANRTPQTKFEIPLIGPLCAGWAKTDGTGCCGGSVPANRVHVQSAQNQQRQQPR